MPRWPKKNKRPGVDEYGRNPLWNYSFKGDIKSVEKELKSGTNPNVGDDSGFTPLHIAIQEWHVEIVKFLLANGANVNHSDINGNIPLWTAINNWQNKYDIIILLLKAGADPRIENNHGNSPMSVLKNIDNDEVKTIIAEKFGNEFSAIQGV